MGAFLGVVLREVVRGKKGLGAVRCGFIRKERNANGEDEAGG